MSGSEEKVWYGWRGRDRRAMQREVKLVRRGSLLLYIPRDVPGNCEVVEVDTSLRTRCGTSRASTLPATSSFPVTGSLPDSHSFYFSMVSRSYCKEGNLCSLRTLTYSTIWLGRQRIFSWNAPRSFGQRRDTQRETQRESAGAGVKEKLLCGKIILSIRLYVYIEAEEHKSIWMCRSEIGNLMIQCLCVINKRGSFWNPRTWKKFFLRLKRLKKLDQ